MDNKLCIPVILGTVRQGRLSEPVAKFIFNQIQQHSEVDSVFIDIRDLPIPIDDAGTDAQIPGLADTIRRADGYIIVTPEYNHTYPSLLKHVLDLNYKEYRHKSVGVCAVSAGPFGGVRVVEALLLTFKAFGLSPIVQDLNFGNVKTLVDASVGGLTEEAQATYGQRFRCFMTELLWLTKSLKYGRENFTTNTK